MKYPEITTVVCTILFVPLVQRSFTAASNYVILSMTKNGLLELQLAHGRRRFLETSLAETESVHRIAVTSATDGVRVVRTVQRDGRLDNCITSTSSQDIASCTSTFSQASGHLVKLPEADVLDAYVKFNKMTYPTFILRRDKVRDQSHSSSNTSPERTDSQPVANFPDVSLWARINRTGYSPFIDLFRTHLQVAKKTRECRTLHENAFRVIQIINTLVGTDLQAVGNLATVNKTTHPPLRLRHSQRYFPNFMDRIHGESDLYRTGEVDPFKTSTSQMALPSDISFISRSSEESRLEDSFNITFTGGKLHTARSVGNVNVLNESVSKTPGLYSFLFVPGFFTHRWKLGNMTERGTTQVTARRLRTYANIGIDRNLQTGRNRETDKQFGRDRLSRTGRYERTSRNQGWDRHFNSQTEVESDIHQEPVGYTETNRRKLTHIHRQTEHGSEKHQGPDTHHRLDRHHEAQIYIGIDRLRGSEKHYQLDKYNVSDRLYASYRHHRTDKLHASDRQGETDRHVWSEKHRESDRRNGNNINHRRNSQRVSYRHYKSDRHHRSMKDRRSDIHRRLDRHQRSNRPRRSDIHHQSDRHDKAHRDYKTHRYDESHTHNKTDIHKGSHRHHIADKYAESDRRLETASVSLPRLTMNVSDNAAISNTQARTSGDRDVHAARQGMGSTHGDQSRSRGDLLTGWMIFPGTKWCGDGDIAEHQQDMGYHSELDTCCRRHDLCPLVIPRLTWKYGLFNYRLHTLSHCACDRKLRKCLKASSSPLAHLIGQIYFNVIGPECFKFTQRTTCVQRLWWGGCLEWSTNKVAYSKRQRRFK